MVRLREIPRTAAFAWSPGAASPLVATGTKAGAVDIDFSNETCLELWDLGLDGKGQSSELKPSGKAATEAGFHDLAWTNFGTNSRRGIIAGALDDGSLSLWDADKLLAGDESSLVSSTKKHGGAIKALQFNPKHSNLVATGGTKGELYITDLNDVSAPTRLGSTAARADDIDCLDWNKKVAHIMVSGSSGGFVTVWDMKTKKESLTLNNMGRRAVSAVAWDPEKPTRLITAIPLEQEPLILVWDLRNANAPERTLRGHESGILSLSWCTQDSDLLLSCGKDNRTICWNPQTGEALGDFPVVTNWTFQTRWNPHNPNLFATASFDGKVSVQTLQSTNPGAAQESNQGQSLDGEDFFSKAQSQPQTASFSLAKAPKWMERPVSVSFGFGGRIVAVRPSQPGTSRASKVEIVKFEVDSDVGASTDVFEQALQSGDLRSVCESRIANAKNEEDKGDWKVIQTLVAQNPRKELVDYLGFNETDEAADGIAKLGIGDDQDKSSEPKVNGAESKGHKRFSSMFESTPDGDFLSELAATKGTKTNNPFQIYSGSESESDRRITRALLLGQFDKALDVCLQEDRMADAFMLAICGGESSIRKAQDAYFSKQSDGPNYLRLLASVVGKNLWDVVHNADLKNWKEVMATLCTFADEKEFPDLCDALGDRLEEKSQSQRDACFCFLAGSKLEKVVPIWLDELQEQEAAGAAQETDGSAFSIHARGLQGFIEKVTVFRKVTNFQDTELSKTSEWKLDQLYSKYLEYADIVASHGQLAAAERYLDLVPAGYPEAEVARSRIKQATKKSAPVVTSSSQPTTGRQKPLPAAGGYQPQQSTFMPTPPAPSYGAPAPAQPSNTYASPAAAPSGNPYAPQQASHAQNPYAPTGGYQQPQQMRGPGMPAPPPYGSFQPSSVPPPPRASNQSPAIPPPSKVSNMSNWNDIPDNFAKAPTPRRGTPTVAAPPVAQPFNVQQPASPPQGPLPPPMAPPYGAGKRAPPPVPPPPRGGAPPPRTMSPKTTGPPQSYPPPNRPASSASNAYAPPPPQSVSSPPIGQHMMQPPIPRGPSPYNAPPSNAPPPNRYAPAPGSQQPGPPQPLPRSSIPPPPQASAYQSGPLPANPYAPSQPPQQAPAQSPYARMPSAPPQAPPQASPPPAQAPPAQGPPQQTSRPDTAQSETRSSKSQSKSPPDYEKLIPPPALPIYTILKAEFSRVAPLAPPAFKKHVIDLDRRLGMLYDHLAKGDLIKQDTIPQLVELAQALQARDYERAQTLQTDIHRDKMEECGQWMAGVKRLIAMSRATP
ncbi:Protein transport protein sec31 [Endocarpon pusillum Z07020]|uniref:Protein transport protein SEC31 n=1 Tax=Endocarpon pusillum (strain Z07020 / HMAS-L-300199) TaxID=1263415 RepID=U1GTJ4_ENDPU|nr:Protein transport protein sec31 [Endocarpon pusillum Z07020]ERF75723.1 Protein transport protein sec31 [Endocarpon pusillum Z07020]